jgi:hypothetical protein
LVVGESNTLSGPTSVALGFRNIAAGIDSTVTAVQGNEAHGPVSTISGGCLDRAEGVLTPVSGGVFNVDADGDGRSLGAWVGGGAANTASGGLRFGQRR